MFEKSENESRKLELSKDPFLGCAKVTIKMWVKRCFDLIGWWKQSNEIKILKGLKFYHYVGWCGGATCCLVWAVWSFKLRMIKFTHHQRNYALYSHDKSYAKTFTPEVLRFPLSFEFSTMLCEHNI